MTTQLPTRQARVAAVALHLATLKPRDVITNQQIRDDLGLDTSDLRDASVFRDGRRRATRDHGVVLRSIRGEGYARLTDEEVANDDSRLRRVRSQARRGMEELRTVDPRHIDQGAQVKLAAKMLVLSAVESQTKPSTVRAIKPGTTVDAARAILASAAEESP